MLVDVRFAKLINTGFLACSIFAQQGFAKIDYTEREIIFFRANYFMGPFSGYFEGASTFLTPQNIKKI
jgi:hypothetical protein